MARKKVSEAIEAIMEDVVVVGEPVFTSIDEQLTRAWLHTSEQSFGHMDYQFIVIRSRGSLKTELRMLNKRTPSEWVVGTVEFLDGAGAKQWKEGVQEKAESMIKEYGITDGV
jgi:hypothetical protein